MKSHEKGGRMNNLIDRAEAQTAIQSVARRYTVAHEAHGEGKVVWSDDLISATDAMNVLREISSAQPEKETPKRVLWSGWKGMRDTRYKCPNCKKPVRNTDIYCHRCGQKLMFPNIDFTPYVEGQKQELIVRWDDEE